MEENEITGVKLPPFLLISKKDIVLFFRQLSVLLRSGVSIVQAISVLHRQTRKKGLRLMLESLMFDVEQGLDLSEAMRRTGKFSLYDVSMVKSSEESGELDTIMETVAEAMEKNMEFRGQIITSMIYPAMVTIMTFSVMIFLSVFVVPKFATVLGGQGKTLPAVTQLMLTITGWMQQHWIVLVGTIVGCGIAFPILRKVEAVGAHLDRLVLYIPVFGSIVRSGIVVNFSRNLGILIQSGVPLSDALLTVRDTLKNAVAHEVLSSTWNGIMEGESMADTLRKHERIFPLMVTEMVATGEETGEMVMVLQLTAQIYQKMLEQFVKRMNAMIEPILIVIMGGMVGFVVIALILGIFSMYL